jgi:spermidine/putrescine-binding protein
MKSGVSRRRFLAGTGAVAAGLSFIPRRGWSAEEAKVNFYNWDTYIGETTLDDFQDASGIEVKMDLFADNDELFAKLKEGNPGYDLIVPTNDYVERMIIAHQLRQHRSGLPGLPIRSGPQVLGALYVGHPGYRLSEVEGFQSPG